MGRVGEDDETGEGIKAVPGFSGQWGMSVHGSYKDLNEVDTPTTQHLFVFTPASVYIRALLSDPTKTPGTSRGAGGVAPVLLYNVAGDHR